MLHQPRGLVVCLVACRPKSCCCVSTCDICGQCFVTVKQPAKRFVELRLAYVLSIWTSPKHLLYVLLGIHVCPHGLASIAQNHVSTADRCKDGHNGMLWFAIP